MFSHRFGESVDTLEGHEECRGVMDMGWQEGE